MKSKPENGGTEKAKDFVTLYLTGGLKAKLLRLAKSEKRSLTNMIEVLISQALEFRRGNGEKETNKSWGEYKTPLSAQQASDS